MSRFNLDTILKNLAARTLAGLLFISSVAAAQNDIAYQVENFSRHAHKKMGDNGFNAVYRVSIEKVYSFLPQPVEIKQGYPQYK